VPLKTTIDGLPSIDSVTVTDSVVTVAPVDVGESLVVAAWDDV
jgi:hypothetical protein